MSAHAKLSASGSARWINCPGSVRMEDGISDKGSTFAQEGTAAHELAELVLTKGGSCFDWESRPLIENSAFTVDHEMADRVQVYVDYVKQFGGEHQYEQRVDFSEWVPGGFGTSDAIVIDGSTLRVIDLKYGKGVEVYASENTQGILYALGAYSEAELFHPIERVIISIVQPRRDHIDEWELSVTDLLKWGERIAQAAEQALSDNAPRKAGEKQCQFCKAKPFCPEQQRLAHDVIMTDFDCLDFPSVDRLSDADLSKALAAKKQILGWLDAVEQYASERLEAGEGFPGFKLVAGRSTRQWGDETEAAATLSSELGDDAFERKLVSVAKAEKLLGKKRIGLLNGLVVKPEGRPTIVPDSDPRPALGATAEDFENIG